MISVIIPIYNVSKYLRKCVDSILAQTYKEIETILVDDGTPDDCAVICDEYLLNNSNMIAIHKPNGGLSDARNKGLDVANGDYINFLDSDDYVKAEMLEKMQEAIENSKADMCLCGFDKIDEYDNHLSSVIYENKVLNKKDALKLLLEGNVNFVVAWGKIYKRNLFRDLYFAKGKLHEDEYIAHYVFSRCEKVCSVNQAYYQYLIRSNSIMRNLAHTVEDFNVSVEISADRLKFFENSEDKDIFELAIINALTEFNAGILSSVAMDKNIIAQNRNVLRNLIKVKNVRKKHIKLLVRVILFKYWFGAYCFAVRNNII